ncbi:MAG: endonuclease MutS2 [Gloeocapsa sp. DLM2.Bin57]|nr:MAG: endonuclease MutS2 [Gloeocapsa sp. DLM2.Bin57]
MIEQETLELLEWHRLCQHLSTFAATKLGAQAALNLTIPDHLATSKELLQQTQEIQWLQEQTNTSWSFEGIKDIQPYLERAQLQGILQGKELLEIATTLAGGRRLRKTIDEQSEIPLLQSIVANLRSYPELEQEIYHCISDNGEVENRASPKLAGIRSQLKEIRQKIQKTLQGIIQRQSHALQETLITQRSDRYVLPVKTTHKEQIPGIVHDSSSTGVTIYVEPQVIIPLGNQLKQLVRREQAEIEIILKALTAKVAIASADLEHLVFVVTTLDLATARANYSYWLKAKPPQLLESDQEDTITLRDLKHPLLVWQEKHEQGGAVVPITVQIKPEIRVVAITGPNTGGKTVTLKTIGLAALMAKVGLYIPAADPVQIPWFKEILADIGDEQSLEQSLSTFSGHIKRIIRIINAIGTGDNLKSSLVLLDEVGAGTDPAEGSALAIALLQYFADKTWLTIATTHYGELKALKYQDSRFENASVEFDEETLGPTYRLLWGIPGRSNALSIALRLGLTQEIVAEAKNKVGTYSQEINQVIAGLEAQRKDQETKAKAASDLLTETERFYHEISTKAKELEIREKELKIAQNQTIQAEIDQAKSQIAQVIRELQQRGQTAQNAQKARENLEQIASNYLKTPSKPQKDYQPQLGEKIRIPSLGQTAEVLTLPDSQGQLTVRFGLMKMLINLSEIESLDGKKAQPPAKIPTKPVTVTTKPSKITVRTTANTLDIRGARVAEAERELEKAIASITDYQILWIIHGKGSGKLRQGVHSLLKQHPQVERFELAPQNEGGAGVTMVYLK